MDFGKVKGSIRFKMLGGVLALEILMTLGYVGVFYHSARADLAAGAQKAVERSQGVYDLILQGDTKMLGVAMDSFATNAAARQIYADHQDRQKLLASVQDLFRSNRARYGITHFYFIDKEGACYLRVHDPGNYGDTVARETFRQARAAGKAVSGIELGKTAFALRVVSPYIHNGDLIGYIEFGEEIDHFDQLVKRQTGVDVAVLVDKAFLVESEYRATRKAQGKPDNWAAMKGYTLVSSTLENQGLVADDASEDKLRAVKTSMYLGTVANGPKTLSKGAFPLKDASGKQVGVVLALNDITDQLQSERSALLLLIGITAIVFVISFAAVALYLRVEVIGPLVRLADQANEISMGKVEMKLETHRNDEIGLLIHAFERMRVSLKKSMSMLTKRE
ncbi:MAG: HAMP domain-containing protein [Acidobacteria bacterium]|nr:HAMP domain-containing protein [Acidobacteriota bacterium]MBI3487706.1 HAMP domain-containing protein [Acidobacteriota bacterium]